jgi:hypothetical protein
MAAPTKPADVKKSLANPEPSTQLFARVLSCERESHNFAASS